jgi:hypothetical protein
VGPSDPDLIPVDGAGDERFHSYLDPLHSGEGSPCQGATSTSEDATSDSGTALILRLASEKLGDFGQCSA